MRWIATTQWWVAIGTSQEFCGANGTQIEGSLTATPISINRLLIFSVVGSVIRTSVLGTSAFAYARLYRRRADTRQWPPEGLPIVWWRWRWWRQEGHAKKEVQRQSRRLWRFLWLLFHPSFPSCLFPYLRNFDAFRKANDMEWEANDKTLWLLSFCLKMVTLWSGWRRKEAFNPQFELADLCGGKAYWKKKGISREEVNKHSLVHSWSELRNNSNCRGKYSAKWKLKWKRQ